MGAGRWASAHAGLLVAAAVALAFATAASVARCVAIHAPEGAAEATPEELADEALPEVARSLRGSYTDATEEALSLLAANAWADGSGTGVVTFTDRAWCVRSQGREDWTAYVVAASARRQEADGDGSVATVTTLCVATAEGAGIATLTAPAAGEGLASFQCPEVLGGSVLTLSPRLKALEVDGPGEDVLAARGTSAGEVETALAEWCALWRPTATTATWEQVVEEDHAERVARVCYRLDDRRGSSVTLVVGMDDGALSVEEGGR